jgi:hypothetical protein
VAPRLLDHRLAPESYIVGVSLAETFLDHLGKIPSIEVAEGGIRSSNTQEHLRASRLGPFNHVRENTHISLQVSDVFRSKLAFRN